MNHKSNKLTRPEFFKVCKALETEYAELKDCSSQPKLAAKLSQLIGLTVPISSVVAAITATGLAFEFRKPSTGAFVQPSSRTWRYVRNLTRHLILLYKELGVKVPDTLENQLKEMAATELQAEEPLQSSTPRAPTNTNADAFIANKVTPQQPITKPQEKK